jgi:hypothetical protein
MALLSISRAEEKIKKGNVIAMSGAPKGRAKKQSAKRGLPEEGLIMRIAPQSGMLKTHFTEKRSQ